MKYRIIIFNYYHYQPGSNTIMVYCKHTTLARTHPHAHPHSRAHTRARTQENTHTNTAVAVQVIAVRRVDDPYRDGVNAFFRRFRWRNGRSLLHSNKQSRGRLGIHDSFWCFSRKPITKLQAEPRRELVRGSALTRYEQFETSPR